jgi:hypothetical protein
LLAILLGERVGPRLRGGRRWREMLNRLRRIVEVMPWGIVERAPIGRLAVWRVAPRTRDMVAGFGGGLELRETDEGLLALRPPRASRLRRRIYLCDGRVVDNSDAEAIDAEQSPLQSDGHYGSS